MSLDDLYQELLLDHFRHPRCHGNLVNPDSRIELRNPLCGDVITLELKSKDGIISEVAFSGHGCSISQASASMMCELLKGKSIAEGERLAQLFRKMIKSEVEGDTLDQLGDARALEGVKKFTARIKCALLAWDCIERLTKPQSSDA